MATLKASQADKALIQYEAGQELSAMAVMTTTDGITYTSADSPWSGVVGKEPVIRPNGLITGGVITYGASEGKVNVSAASAYLSGELEEPVAMTGASGVALDYTQDNYITHSIVMYLDGATPKFKSIAGDDDLSAHSNTRGGDGGPPLVGADEIEIGWVRTVGASAAAVSANDIVQITGTSVERYDYPMYGEDYGAGSVEFIATNPSIHTDTKPRKVFAEIYTPLFAPIEPASNFVPPETTHSQSSTTVYGGAIGSSSSSLGQGSFSAYLKDGVTDAILALKNETLWFRFYPNKLRAPHLLAQGKLGISRTFPADNAIVAACTISADGPAIEVSA